jgi:hypothetical protein
MQGDKPDRERPIKKNSDKDYHIKNQILRLSLKKKDAACFCIGRQAIG